MGVTLLSAAPHSIDRWGSCDIRESSTNMPGPTPQLGGTRSHLRGRCNGSAELRIRHGVFISADIQGIHRAPGNVCCKAASTELVDASSEHRVRRRIRGKTSARALQQLNWEPERSTEPGGRNGATAAELARHDVVEWSCSRVKSHSFMEQALESGGASDRDGKAC